MLAARAVLSCLLGAACFAWASHTPGVGGRQLDRFSPIVRSIQDQPVPEDLEGLRVAAFLLDLAHDPGAPRLHGFLERQALLELLGEPQPPRPEKVELAIASMQGEKKNIGALRERVLRAPVQVEVLRERDPALEAEAGGSRHEAASMWVQEGGRWRSLGVRITNATGRALHSGAFALEFGAQGSAFIDFSCRYRQLAPGESRVIACSGAGDRSAEPVLRVIRGEAAATARHREVAFVRPGGRVTVDGSMTRFDDDDHFVSQRALARLDQESCRQRGTCGTEAREGILARPMVLGALLGLVAGGVYAIFLAVRGQRSADRAAAVMSVALFLVMTAGIIALVATISQAHVLLVLLLAGFAAGQAGDVMMGFFMGLVASVAILEVARVRREMR